MEKKMQVLEGELLAQGLKIALVCSRFNEFFVSKLLSGAVDAFKRHGGSESDLVAAWVPGAYELPFAVKKLAASGRFDAVVALGVVIKGATPHAEYINNEVSKALAEISMQAGIPVGYGLITAENIEQAVERSGCKAGNKGVDAMMAAVEMANLNKKLK